MQRNPLDILKFYLVAGLTSGIVMVYAFSMIYDAFEPGYDVPAAVHMLVGSVIGLVGAYAARKRGDSQ